jgi:hypothetical protein
MDNETLEQKFHRDTIRAMASLEADRRYAIRRWFMVHGYAALLFQLLGLATWLVSAQGAAAVAVTITLYSVYSGLSLTVRARRYAKLEALPRLDEAVRFHTSMAWYRLGLVFRLRTMAFGNLCAGMTLYSVWQFAEGSPLSAPVMDRVVIACTFLNLLLLPVFHAPRVLKPLLDRLGPQARNT